MTKKKKTGTDLEKQRKRKKNGRHNRNIKTRKKEAKQKIIN